MSVASVQAAAAAQTNVCAQNLSQRNAPTPRSAPINSMRLRKGFCLGGSSLRKKASRNSNASQCRTVSVRASANGDQGDSHGDWQSKDLVVVGGGVSGLTVAFGVVNEMESADVLVTEARSRVGGNITTMRDGDYLWEEGPNSFQPGDPILSTACDVGLQQEIELADPNSYRFVYWEGQLRALPANPVDAVFGDFLTFPGKIRAGLGAIGVKSPPPDREESVKEFVSRNLGEEAFERLIEPFCSGVYAGDPKSLSAEAATGRVQRLEPLGGSLVAGAIMAQKEKAATKQPRDPRLPLVTGQTVGSFKEGLITLPNALEKKLGDRVRVNWQLTRLTKLPEGGFGLEYNTPDGPAMLRAKAVVLTAPAYVTADTIEELSKDASDALKEFYYPPVCAVTTVYPKSAFREPEHGKGALKGFGQLHPRSQGIRTLGTIYCSHLFPGRCPENEGMLLNYIGGAQDPAIADMSEGDIVEQVHKDALQTLLKPGTEMPKLLGLRLWPKAIPQFNLGHMAVLDRAEKALQAAGADGLYLGGNYKAGVALGRCVEYAREQAVEIAAKLKSMPEQNQPGKVLENVGP